MTPEYILMWIGDVIQVSSGSVNKYGKWMSINETILPLTGKNLRNYGMLTYLRL